MPQRMQKESRKGFGSIVWSIHFFKTNTIGLQGYSKTFKSFRFLTCHGKCAVINKAIHRVVPFVFITKYIVMNSHISGLICSCKKTISFCSNCWKNIFQTFLTNLKFGAVCRRNQLEKAVSQNYRTL